MSDNKSKLITAPIGPRLRRLRKAKRFSLGELAAKVGTSAPTLHRYESGWDRFELGTLRRLARALDARLVISLEPIRRPESAQPVSDDALVEQLRPLFWDVDLTATHLVENPAWLLRRVLQFGDWDAVHQARLRFGDAAVRQAAAHRSMDPRTRRFWQVVLDAEEEQL